MRYFHDRKINRKNNSLESGPVLKDYPEIKRYRAGSYSNHRGGGQKNISALLKNFRAANMYVRGLVNPVFEINVTPLSFP